MGGLFGAISRRDITLDVFFGVDYHSHLGIRNGGLAFLDEKGNFQNQIHSILTAPFRTKFEDDLDSFQGRAGIGCISDTDPQPLMVRSHLGRYAIAGVGRINNMDEIVSAYTHKQGAQFMLDAHGEVSPTAVVSALINEGTSFEDGIAHAQDIIEGSMTILLLTEKDGLIVARDKAGRIPVLLGKGPDGFCVSMESFAYEKLGYQEVYELGSGEIVKIQADGFEVLRHARDTMRICAFLWTYYGYPNSNYEGVNVELMRYRNGENMARTELELEEMPEVDYVAGVPDSGIPHALGYANVCPATYARPFVKYTPTWPRSFLSTNKEVRELVAEMKQIPVPELIEGKRLLFVDDSIVRGTQLESTVKFLYHSGAKAVHMRSACPPIMYPCKFLNFSRNNESMTLLARRVISRLEGERGNERIQEYADGTTDRGKLLRSTIARDLGFESLGYQTLEGLLDAISIPEEHVCTYCWTGKE